MRVVEIVQSDIDSLKNTLLMVLPKGASVCWALLDDRMREVIGREPAVDNGIHVSIQQRGSAYHHRLIIDTVSAEMREAAKIFVDRILSWYPEATATEREWIE